MISITVTVGVVPWYRDPERGCKGDDRFSDLTLVKPPARAEQIEDMINTCISHCPVYYECLADLLAHPMWEHYGVRAGIRGKA